MQLRFLATPVIAASAEEAQAEAARSATCSDAAVEHLAGQRRAFLVGRRVPGPGRGDVAGHGRGSFQITDLGLVGSTDTVAGTRGEIMAEVGGDGFLLSTPPTRLQIAEITDGLGPASRKRGLVRDGCTCLTLEENLQEF